MSTGTIGYCVRRKCELTQYSNIRECKNLHKVCGECATDILDESEDGRVSCPECGESLRKASKPENEPVYVFVDNSNIWTEAKKKVARELNLKCLEDPRVRIEVGKLADVVSGDRPVAKGKLYGSEPPPTDSVWKKIKEKKFEVEVFKRSAFTGKEKQVDQQLVADITTTVCDHSIYKGTIAIVCGDADVLPAIKKAIEKGWRCEVWIWEQCCAHAIKETQRENSTLMKVVFLDDYTNDVTYVDCVFKQKKLTKYLEMTSAVIVKANEVEELQKAGWESNLSKYLKHPFRHFFTGADFDDLVLVFQNLSLEEDFDKVMKKLCKIECLTKTEVKRYVVYSNSAAKFTETAGTKLKNSFDVLQSLPKESASTATTAVVSGKEPSDNNKFQVVTHKRKTKGRKENPKKYSEECDKGAYCNNGAQCSFHHTKEELKFFRGGKSKALACYWRYDCRKQDTCGYAHDKTDSFCRYCSQWGHLEGEAKMEKCFQKKPSGGSDV